MILDEKLINVTSSQPFDLNFLEELLSQPERTARSRKAKDTRDYDTWFTLDHIVMGTCSNPKCISVELERPQGRNRVTASVNSYEMCRFCFLYEWHKVS